jgi:hypothetical protein
MLYAYSPRGMGACSIFFEIERLKICFVWNGDHISMRQIKTEESKVLTFSDEHAFFTLIEERLEQQGFELLDTLSPLDQPSTLADAAWKNL